MSTSKNTDLLAPIEIWEVILDNRTIKFHKPLVLTPQQIQGDGAYLVVEVPELGLSAFGSSREDLWDCIQSCIRMAWKEYVCEDDCNLLPLAKAYKNAYLSISEAVDG